MAVAPKSKIITKFKITLLAAILLQIQNGVATSCLESLFTSGNHNNATVRFQNNKLKLVLK